MRSCRAPSREWRLQWNDFLRQSQCCFYKPRWSWPRKTTSRRSAAKNELHKEQQKYQKVVGVHMLCIAYPSLYAVVLLQSLDTSKLLKHQTHRLKDPSTISKIENFGLTSRSGVATVGVAGSKRPRCRWTKFLCHATFGEVGVSI